MLYNPGIQQKQLLLQFIGWLSTKPANEEYEYMDARMCACAQFARFMGQSDGVINREWEWVERASLEPLARGGWIEDGGWGRRTFGALLERARMALANLD